MRKRTNSRDQKENEEEELRMENVEVNKEGAEILKCVWGGKHKEESKWRKRVPLFSTQLHPHVGPNLMDQGEFWKEEEVATQNEIKEEGGGGGALHLLGDDFSVFVSSGRHKVKPVLHLLHRTTGER